MSASVDPLARGVGVMPSSTGGNGGAFAKALDRALRGADAAPTVGASTTAEPDAQAALELQAAVYRHAERIELASRLVDSCVGLVKTILQTRV